MNYIGEFNKSAGLAVLISAARDKKPVSGFTHNFYRYPARFSPTFVGAVIDAFSEPGDWVVDPFVGGGTTLVEAMVRNRNALGTDISSLATFISEAKTIVLDGQSEEAITHWIADLPGVINMHLPGCHATDYCDEGYYRNITGPKFWRLRKGIEQALASAVRIVDAKAQTLARCIVLKTAQWALDGRKIRPSIAEFRKKLIMEAYAMVDGAMALRARLNHYPTDWRPKVICIHRSADGIERDERIAEIGPPKLIVTSPPYPGVHVLYHRWQVDGRKEAPAPFWIANRLDGAGLSYYAMGDRKRPGLNTYFENLERCFRSIARISGPKTTIVQMVAFSEPDWQLPRYLEVMEACGLRELTPWNLSDSADGRLWRDVPNRKWHAQQRERAFGAREVVLVHIRG